MVTAAVPVHVSNQLFCVGPNCVVSNVIVRGHVVKERHPPHSTVTDFAKFRGLSTSVPRANAV